MGQSSPLLEKGTTMAKAKNTTTNTTTTTTAKSVMAPYAPFIANFSKLTGPVPSAANIEQAHAFGLRVGKKATFAMAMYLRPGGATAAQVAQAVSGQCLNVAREMVTRGKVKPIDLPHINGMKVYAYEVVTPKAEKAKAEKAPRKPRAPRKPKSDKQAPAAPATGDAPVA